MKIPIYCELSEKQFSNSLTDINIKITMIFINSRLSIYNNHYTQIEIIYLLHTINIIIKFFPLNFK